MLKLEMGFLITEGVRALNTLSLRTELSIMK